MWDQNSNQKPEDLTTEATKEHKGKSADEVGLCESIVLFVGIDHLRLPWLLLMIGCGDAPHFFLEHSAKFGKDVEQY